MDKKQLQSLMQGKTNAQRIAYEYFYKEPGCLSSKPSDQDYNNLVQNRLKELNTQDRALEKLGVDIDQVNEISPVNFHGYDLDEGPYLRQNSGEWVTPRYEFIWVFFSDSQIYIYHCSFNMFNNGIDESTQEYFYKDVTSFKTATYKPKNAPQDTDIRYEKFSIIVPGDSVSVSMTGTEENSTSIVNGMKQKLREKKNS